MIHKKLFRFDGPIEDAREGRRRGLGFRRRKPNPNSAGRGAGDQIGFVLQNGIEKPFGFTFIPIG
jgi:hypothetical protein